ncbi:histidine kinase [Micrococcus luteus]|uniref:sensor histidine kinase n=2 Tax=Micrococcaceae TaxID=1268 RepID=UPI0008593EE2|nr:MULTISPECIES: histidine kinase [Micrococcus]MBO1028455.1 two-component sensor histidine kinase [Micrococcus luteus]MBY0174862.1 two-component sensor histidine kinase [Micrococcus luteus]MCT1872037.1 histidine kinase [Micrococcus luteus]MCV7502098.1 histidine kinase [Micrococcus luteus]MCV7535466.1 histidine kinase [Micrococcus luteus]
MNPLRRLDQWTRLHPVRTDVMAAAALFTVLVALPWIALGPMVAPDPQGRQTAVSLLAGAGMVLPWAVRRVRPVASAAVVTAAAVLHLLAGPEFSLSLLMVPLTVYNLAANAPRSVSVAGLLLGLVGGVANGVKVWLFPAQFVTPDGLTVRSPAEPLAMVIMAIGCGLMVLTAWAFGDVVRNRRLTVRALEDRAHRLEVQSRQERELAAADERSHIAREMHDIVAHSLQVIISQADGARYAAAAKPALAVTALETIGQTGRSALADMRQLLGVLRETGETVAGVPGVTDDDARRPAADVVASPDGRGTRLPPGRRPQPRLADLPALVETMRLSGLEVSLLETGTPRRTLPAGGELAAYRIVQEALTNTLRHGGPDADAFVTLAWTAHGLDLQIDDDGCGAAADPATRGSGQGLRGAAERTALFGGTLETGPRVGAGYRVSAHLPYSAV